MWSLCFTKLLLSYKINYSNVIFISSTTVVFSIYALTVLYLSVLFFMPKTTIQQLAHCRNPTCKLILCSVFGTCVHDKPQFVTSHCNKFYFPMTLDGGTHRNIRNPE